MYFLLFRLPFPRVFHTICSKEEGLFRDTMISEICRFIHLAGGNGSESSNSERAENVEASVRSGGSRENGSSPLISRHALCSCSVTTKDSIRMKRGSPTSVPPHTTQGNNQEKASFFLSL